MNDPILASPAALASSAALSSQMRQAINGRVSEASMSMNAVQSSGTVQRTRRVVRQQAVSSIQQRRRILTVSVACLLCSAVMAVLTVPLWNQLDEFAHWSGIPDLQIHMLFLGVWFLPGTVAALLLWRGLRRNQDSATS